MVGLVSQTGARRPKIGLRSGVRDIFHFKQVAVHHNRSVLCRADRPITAAVQTQIRGRHILHRHCVAGDFGVAGYRSARTVDRQTVFKIRTLHRLGIAQLDLVADQRDRRGVFTAHVRRRKNCRVDVHIMGRQEIAACRYRFGIGHRHRTGPQTLGLVGRAGIPRRQCDFVQRNRRRIGRHIGHIPCLNAVNREQFSRCASRGDVGNTDRIVGKDRRIVVLKPTAAKNQVAAVELNPVSHVGIVCGLSPTEVIDLHALDIGKIRR